MEAGELRARVHQLKAQNLASLSGRHSPETWLRRAFQAAQDEGVSVGQLDDRLDAYLDRRTEAATEQAAAAIRAQVARTSGVVPERLMAAERVRVAAEGGISHEHAVDLGYESLLDWQQSIST